jgi:DNA repair exonuclease SbcCD ATPase subunit
MENQVGVADESNNLDRSGRLRLMSTNVASPERPRSRGKELAAELADVIDQLQSERDRLSERVAQLEAECKRLSSERNRLLHALIDATTTEEELNRIRNEPGGRTWAEIKQRLESL